MKQTAQPDASHTEKTTEPTRSRPAQRQAFASGSHLAQLAGMMNGSPRLQALTQMKEDIQRSAHVQNLQRLSAAQLSESVRSPIASGEPAQLKIGIAGTLAHGDRVAGQDRAMEEHDSSAAESPSSSSCGCSSKQETGVGANRQTRSKQERPPAQKKSNGEERSASAQRKEDSALVPNRTGLPDRLKAGVENLSGLSLDDVKVHYNSAHPAQLNALAYAQGADIHVAPGQEKHLPHEAWHIVQQKEGRVRPTMQLRAGVSVNDDAGLEKEADVMGAKSLPSAVPRPAGPEQRSVSGENAQQTISGRVQLEKARTASSATSTIIPIQARFDIELLFQEPGKREALFAKGISIDDLEEIQELLEDTETVNGYLQELEAAMERWFKDPASEYKYTAALDMALFEQEKKWMVPQEAQPSKTSKGFRNKVEADQGQEKQSKFLGRIKGAEPLKDVGAAVSHGEYAHRIQWYVISRSALSIGSISPALLKDIYSFLGEMGYLKEIDKYVATAIGNEWSLWGAVVDVPASAAKAKPTKPGQESLGAVGFSAPVDLTTHISKGEGGLKYSQLQLAILNRRIKRYFEPQNKGSKLGRVDSELAGMFQALAGNPAKLPAEQHERVMKMLSQAPDYDKSSIKEGAVTHGTYRFDYDERNYIAFALSGIPLSS